MAFIPLAIGETALLITEALGVTALTAGAGAGVAEFTGIAALGALTEAGLTAGAVYGISEGLKEAPGRDNYEIAVAKELAFWKEVLHGMGPDNYGNWGPELTKQIKDRHTQIYYELKAQKDLFDEANQHPEQFIINDNPIRHIDEEFVQALVPNRSSIVDTVGPYVNGRVLAWLGSKGADFLETVNSELFVKYRDKYNHIFEWKYIRCKVYPSVLTPDSGLPVRVWTYEHPDHPPKLIWSTEYNKKGRTVIPSLYGVYVGAFSRNDASPMMPAGYDPDGPRMSSLDLICGFHDLGYNMWGFSQRADMILLAMLFHNYEFFNELEKKVSLVATNYFFTAGKLVSKKDAYDENFGIDQWGQPIGDALYFNPPIDYMETSSIDELVLTELTPGADLSVMPGGSDPSCSCPTPQIQILTQVQEETRIKVIRGLYLNMDEQYD